MSSPPPTKKRKLPTIKKNKVPAAPTPTPTPATTLPAPSNPTSSPHKSPPTEPSADKAKPKRTPAALIGNADFDLRKPSVYAELFKAVSHCTVFFQQRLAPDRTYSLAGPLLYQA
jgi:hypothetical protein